MLCDHGHSIHVVRRAHARERACFPHENVRGCAHECICGMYMSVRHVPVSMFTYIWIWFALMRIEIDAYERV